MSPILLDMLVTMLGWLAIAFGLGMVYIADRTAKPAANEESPTWRLELVGKWLKPAIAALILGLILVGISPFVSV